MKHILLTVVLLCLNGAALAADATAMSDKYARECADCHGRKADRAAFGKAPPLITLSREQVVSALTDRRDGKIATRGAEQRAKSALTDDDIQGLADYIHSLSPQNAAAGAAPAN